MRTIAWLIGGSLLAAAIFGIALEPRQSLAQADDPKLKWIWSADGAKLNAPAEPRYFRRTIELARNADQAIIDITADDEFKLWVDGKEVGSGETWQRVYRFNVSKFFKAGKIAIAVEANNTSPGAAGLLVRVNYATKGQPKVSLTSDQSWKVSKSAPNGWRDSNFDDSKWEAAVELGKYGEGPWKNVEWTGGEGNASRGRFVVPKGFKVEMVVPASTRIPGFHDQQPKGKRSEPNFSLVNMCFDNKGRLLASQEGGPIVLFTDPDAAGVFQKTRIFCDAVRNAHGMCWIKDYLYVVGDGKDDKGGRTTGLFRGKRTESDEIVRLELLHRFDGGMGEHGPHAVIHGPDDKLYVAIGNHAHAKVDRLASNSPLKRWPTGAMGPDQGKPNTTEDVLLPRLNDARGHAANILAPGGTIWRFDLDGRNPALVAAGFRNHFDAAFNPAGELFTFDSDMEWDEGLPWYRHVRVCHCTPGADFVWRTGAANTPNYYADSLPPMVETGRGSPTGVEFYDHSLFGPKYRGAFFMCDWSIGTIWVVTLNRDGATYKGKAEKFCSGSPMPVTDCAVGPEGALYFTLGGRNTQGGVYRIVPESLESTVAKNPNDQPYAAWSAARAKVGTEPAAEVKAFEAGPREQSAEKVADYIRAIGFAGLKDREKILLGALGHKDSLVRRRACESLVRLEIEPPVALLAPLLADPEIFVRTAARLVLQRIDPRKWAGDFLSSEKDRVAHEAIIALCKTHQADAFGEAIFERLHDNTPGENAEQLLEWIRTVQLALVHVKNRPGSVRGIALDCREMFPHKDWRVNRELAIVLTEFARSKEVHQEIVPKLIRALEDALNDRPQQIHYFYCLRLIADGWSAEDRMKLLAWYDSTKTWSGGHSFTPFLENIFKEVAAAYAREDIEKVFAKAAHYPHAAAVLLRSAKPDRLPDAKALGDVYLGMLTPSMPVKAFELKEALIETLARSEANQAMLRTIGEKDYEQRGAIARALSRFPTNDNLPHLIRGIETTPAPLLGDLLQTILKVPGKPKPEDGAAFRSVLVSAAKLPEAQKWQAVEVLQHWTGGKQFGAAKGDWKKELTAWGKWFSQAHPTLPALPDIATTPGAESKYKYADLLAYLEKEGKEKGDARKGRAVFEKAQCLKCHKYGEAGEGVGPDLSAIAKRFKRADILEAIYYPSKVISDQYRSSTVITVDGKRFDGILAENGGNYTLVLQDATKLNLKKDDIEKKFESLVSVMPEKLLDELTLQEIADLFAFMDIPVPEVKKP